MQSSEKMENIITDLDYNVKFSYMGAPRSFPEHWHEFVEFIIATDNNGSYSVGNEQYHLDTGDLLLIWPGEMHSNISVTSNSSLLLQFGDNIIYNCHDLMINYRHFKTYHKIGREDMTELNEILTYHMKEAYHIFKSHDPFTETACTIQIYSMLMALGKYIYNNINTSQITSNCSSQNYIKIQNACTYISQNCEKDLSQKDISDIFGFSHFYFSRLFKEYTHMTFNDYLSNERIQRATRLLCEEALPITEIAYQSGFQSISNFNRVFNKITHYSPSEYRKKYNGNQEPTS